MATEFDFKFDQFAVNAISAVDEIRSFGKESITFPIESRINALYRSIGLPAVIKKDSEQHKINNGNTFSAEELLYSDYEDKFILRQNSFRKDITDEEVRTFLLFTKAKPGDGTRDYQGNPRYRGLLFPMVVDGELPIFPQSKRIATAFQKEEDLEVGINKYKRPLIEAIILLRLKTEGVQDTELQDKVAQDYKVDVSQELTNIAKDIENTMRLVVRHLPFILTETIKKINEAKKNTNVDFVPIIANIAQQSVLKSLNSKKVGKYDKQKIIQELQLKSKQILLSFLEYDDTFVSDKKTSRNLKDTALSSSFLSLFDPNAESNAQNKTQKDAEDTDRVIEKSIAELRSGFKTLELLFGTFGALSGIDVLVIIYALFRVPINVLIGLLNKQSKENLIALKGKDIVEKNAVDVKKSIEQLEEKVSSLYKAIDDLITNTSVRQFRQEEAQKLSSDLAELKK